MKKARVPLLIAAAVLLLSACLGAQKAATAPAPGISSINQTATALVQFLTSAPRVTLLATQSVPTQTEMVTMTPFVSITPLPTATATFTNTPFGFVASPTPTSTKSVPIETPDPAEGATDNYGSDYRCALVSKDPFNWTVLKPNRKYKFFITVMNTGNKKWQADGINMIYVAGKNLTRGDRQLMIDRDTRINEKLTQSIDFYAPDYPGNYRAVWGLNLLRTGHVFCTFTIKITIPENSK